MACDTSTGTVCNTPQELCLIHRGDKVVFKLAFTNCGEPTSIVGKTLELAFRERIQQTDPDVVVTTTFGDDANSRKGISVFTLTTSDTEKFTAGITYCFTFKLINGPTDKLTIGTGTAPVAEGPSV